MEIFRTHKMIYTSEASLDYPADATLTQILLYRNLGGASADKSAIIDGASGKVAYTYRSFRNGVEKLATHLRGTLKIEQGMTIGILMTNTVRCFSINSFMLAETIVCRLES